MDFKLPELGEGVYEAELVAWLVKPGDSIKRGQNLMEVMTDKATMEVPSPFAGTIGTLYPEPGNVVKVGDAVLSYTATGKAKEAVAAPVAARVEKPAAQAGAETSAARPSRTGNGNAATVTGERGLPIKAAPSVRYMARKLGIDLGRIRGTGPEGRILIDDLASQMPKTTAREAEAPAEPRPDYGKPGTRIKLAGLRRKVAEHMVVATKTIPHYTYIDECEVTDLIRLREQLKEPFAKQGVKLTYLAFFVKAVVAALKEVPIVNAMLDETTQEIVLHNRYNIGIAVAAPGGLIVPVVHDADKKNLSELAGEIERLSNDARSGHAKLEDLRGGTFTITSIGGIGGLIATPVINHPEVGILGLGKVIKRPVYDAAGNVRPADLIYLSLSLDHRVVDGAVGAAFANVIIKQLQNPAALLM